MKQGEVKCLDVKIPFKMRALNSTDTNNKTLKIRTDPQLS